MLKHRRRAVQPTPKRIIASAIFGWIVVPGALLADTLSLSLESAVAAPGSTVSVRLELGSAPIQPAGLQFTLAYPQFAVTASHWIGGTASALAGKSVTCVDRTASLECVVAGLNSTAISDGTVAILNLQISTDVADGTFDLALSDVIGVSAEGHELAVTGAGSLLTIRPDAGPVFVPATVVNAASLTSGAVAPGELITIFGSGLGPIAGAYGTTNANGTLEDSVAGLQVRFDGHFAPLIFVRSDQINAVVPYEIAGNTRTTVTIEDQGRLSNSAVLPVASSSPALFTLDSSGTGPGAILNQDFSINSANNPAPPGSIVMIYATGAGLMNPDAATGQIATEPVSKPALPVSVSIGGVEARVEFAGAAPNIVMGVVQINVRVPMGVVSGNLPVVLTVGSASSPAVTIAVDNPASRIR